eukprot:gene2812-biopygen3465
MRVYIIPRGNGTAYPGTPMYAKVGQSSAHWFVGSWAFFALIFIVLTCSIADNTAPCQTTKTTDATYRTMNVSSDANATPNRTITCL